MKLNVDIKTSISADDQVEHSSFGLTGEVTNGGKKVKGGVGYDSVEQTPTGINLCATSRTAAIGGILVAN